jgi:GNAT superfamily N-acetyltransferase
MPAIREALPQERSEIEAFYHRAGYALPFTEDDRILIAEQDGRIVGALRISGEGGITVLRGMHVREELQRKGIGGSLLAAAAKVVAGKTCYCIPHAHLESFYGQVGFRKLPVRMAPDFLQERWHEYGRRGLEVIIMIRGGHESQDRNPS